MKEETHFQNKDKMTFEREQRETAVNTAADLLSNGQHLRLERTSESSSLSLAVLLT